MLTFLIYSWLLKTSSGATLIPANEIQAHLTVPNNNIVAFYNVHIDGDRSDNIIQSQVKTLKGSGLLDKLDTLYYSTVGSRGKDFDLGDSKKYVHLAHYEDTDPGSELHILHHLHQFCEVNPSSKVLYFHDKTISHRAHLNATTSPDILLHSPSPKFSSILNCYVLSTHCISALDSHDTCGWRISPTPQTHYSGNFWWARCEYVNMLIDPLAPLNNQTFVEATKSLNQKCVGTDTQSFAETWIGTGTTLLPADCMGANVDHDYIWGNHFPHAAEEHCQAHDPDKASSCTTASTFDHVYLFKKAIAKMNALIPEEECRDNRKEITKLSNLLYGEEPHTYLEWMERLDKEVPPEDGRLFRFDGAQVYVVEGGILRGVPNLKTFIAMGRDFSEVKVLHVSQRKLFYFGDMLPSA